jgi:S-adenosyl-L-methionine hydrolase (adenosine-forming)
VEEVVELTNAEWFAPDVSRTFHGRDVFAPVAARIATGADLAEAGRPFDPTRLVRLPDPVVALGDGWLEAEVTTVDRFGNVQLAAAGTALDALGPSLTVGGVRAVRGNTFADAKQGGLVVYVDSAERVAVAVNGGRAAVVLAVTAGDVLRVTAV